MGPNIYWRNSKYIFHEILWLQTGKCRDQVIPKITQFDSFWMTPSERKKKQHHCDLLQEKCGDEETMLSTNLVII